MSGVVREPLKAQVGYAGGLFKASEKKKTLVLSDGILE